MASRDQYELWKFLDEEKEEKEAKRRAGLEIDKKRFGLPDNATDEAVLRERWREQAAFDRGLDLTATHEEVRLFDIGESVRAALSDLGHLPESSGGKMTRFEDILRQTSWYSQIRCTEINQVVDEKNQERREAEVRDREKLRAAVGEERARLEKELARLKGMDDLLDEAERLEKETQA